MLKIRATMGDDREVLILGLSHANLDRLRADGLKDFIEIKGAELGLPVDILITAAATNEALFAAFESGIGPETKVHLGEKLKQ